MRMNLLNRFFVGILVGTSVLRGVFAATAIPLPEHPRPDFERADWINLNGVWNFAFDKADVGEKEAWFAAGNERFPRSITVPFGWGAPLSGLEDEADVGWYRRTVTVPKSWQGRRVFLVFGASDHDTTVWAGNRRVGLHFGGYTPFEVELTEYVDYAGDRTLPITVRVWDEPAASAVSSWRLYGKQGYGNARGLWQTVYLEARAETYLERVRFVSDLKDSSVSAEVVLGAPAKRPMTATLALDDRAVQPQPVAVSFAPGQQRALAKLPLVSPKAWSPDDPRLYDVTVTLRSLDPKRVTAVQQAALDKVADPAAREQMARYVSLRDPGLGQMDFAAEDVVRTYFGFREIGVGRLPGTEIPYVTLNGKPVYLRLSLDQSYHPTGFYTFPSDAFMRREIEIAKELGLNGIRVHIKAEVPRKLYWADRLGLLVMADVPCAWGGPDPRMFAEHWMTFEDMVNRDFNHPSVFSWVLFNESWGLLTDEKDLPVGRSRRRAKLPVTQRKVAETWLKAKALDPTRIVEDESPCNADHVVTDLNSFHTYLAGYSWENHIRDLLLRDTFVGSGRDYIDGFVQTGAPVINSECGAVWGYTGSTGDCDWSWDYHLMMNAFRRHPQLAGWLYTEHHDVTNEWNGYVRFDRTPKETGLGDLFPGMSLKDFHADAYLPLDRELCRTFAAGSTWTVPVDVSLVTDRFAGRRLTLTHVVRWTDASGRSHVGETSDDRVFTAASWQSGRLAEVPVALPGMTACGTICFTLKDGDDVVARNFCCFVTKGAPVPGTVSVAPTAFVASDWTQKSWSILDGRKACGAGKGHFTYSFDVPKGMTRAVFRAELSAKRLNGKDRVQAGQGERDLDCMLGGGAVDRSRNPNSYPMTSTDKHPSELEVFANGRSVKALTLPDDPADHRGILSWHSQPRDQRLHEAGSYGYLVEVEIPADLVAAGRDGKLEIRLAGSDGLAVYGASFGRFPLDPSVLFLP